MSYICGMNSHEINAEYTKSVIPKLEAIDMELAMVIETKVVDMKLYNLSKWHKDHLIDYARLEASALPKNLHYLIP